MKKLMFAAVAALATVGAAQAAQSYGIYSLVWLSPYATYDTNPGAEHTSHYSCYVMKQEDAQKAMDCVGTTVTYSDMATWLDKSFAANKASVIDNAEQLPCLLYNTTYKQYKCANESTSYVESGLLSAICVSFYDDGGNVAYEVIANPSPTAFVMDDTFSSTSGWLAVSTGGVPEPTSGLLLLLGVAGLALKRKRQ